ncbi:MAG: hypothetical protein U0559_09075 [Anaerolineae bacterium]
MIKQAGRNIRFIGYAEEVDKAALLSGGEGVCVSSLYEGFGFPGVGSDGVRCAGGVQQHRRRRKWGGDARCKSIR